MAKRHELTEKEIREIKIARQENKNKNVEKILKTLLLI